MTSSDLFIKIVDARVAARSAAEPRQRRQQVEALRVLLGNKGFLLVSGFGHPGSYLAICGVAPSISYGIISGTDDIKQVLFHPLCLSHRITKIYKYMFSSSKLDSDRKLTQFGKYILITNSNFLQNRINFFTSCERDRALAGKGSQRCYPVKTW